MNQINFNFIPIWIDTVKIEESFLDLAIRQCLEAEQKYPGRQLSNIGGWQSKGYERGESAPEIQAVTNIIESICYTYFKKIQLSMRSQKEFVLSNYWINVNRKNNYNKVHVHPNSMLSGVFYLTENNSKIIFDRYDDVNFWQQCLNSEYCKPLELYPSRGDVIFFPPWLPHYVEPNNTDDVRISVAFNAW